MTIKKHVSTRLLMRVGIGLRCTVAVGITELVKQAKQHSSIDDNLRRSVVHIFSWNISRTAKNFTAFCYTLL